MYHAWQKILSLLIDKQFLIKSIFMNILNNMLKIKNRKKSMKLIKKTEISIIFTKKKIILMIFSLTIMTKLNFGFQLEYIKKMRKYMLVKEKYCVHCKQLQRPFNKEILKALDDQNQIMILYALNLKEDSKYLTIQSK